MGAYDSISVLGKTMRETVAPFWSWNETNFKRYSQFFKNQYSDGDYATIGKVVGKKMGLTVVKTPVALGKFALKASAMWAMLQGYNMTVFPEEEAELSKEEQARPHIILGRDEQGKVRYFSRLGSFGDFLEWFGLDTPTKDVKDLLDGTRSLGEIAKDMAMNPVNKGVQAVTPLIKTPAELLTGKTVYPDISNPRSIKDVPAYIANQAGLNKEFKALSRSDAGSAMGMIPRPDEPYTIPNIVSNLTQYKEEPGRAAYYGVLESKRLFLERQGSSGGGDFNSQRTEIMRNYKAALKYGDKESAQKLKEMFMQAGGKDKGFEQSLKAMEPLAGLSKEDKKKFLESLTNEQKQELEKANAYYNRVLANKE